jgi:hypothetical protein
MFVLPLRREHRFSRREKTVGEQDPEITTIRDAEALYEALESLLGDLYLLGIQAGSAADAMKVLKRSQGYRKGGLQSVAIGCSRVGVKQ